MARIKSGRAASVSRSPEQATTTAISSSMQSPEKYKASFCPDIASLPGVKPAHAAGCKEIVFIDQGVEDYSHLIAAARAGVMVHVIDSSRDGVRQMSAVLQQQSGLSAVHIVSHGSAGCLALGNSLLTVETLERYRGDLFAWQQALKDHAEILLYGCNVGQGALGEYFVRQLADMTGANIAASTTLTGHASKQGDWELAFTIGEIKCPIAFTDNLAAAYPGVLVAVENYDVDPGLGSFPTSFELNGFVYAFTDEGDGGDFGWINQYGVGDSGFVSPGSLGASNTGTTESFTIRKSDGTPFLFKEIWIFAELDDVTVAGMLNGSAIDSTIISAGVAWAAASFSGDGTVIDTLKISSVDFIPNLDGIDNFKYSLALPNASPNLTINNDNSLLYTENDTATQIDASAILNDPDGDADWDGGTLTIQITGNAEAADHLSIVNHAVGSIHTFGNKLKDGATEVGTLSADEGTVSGGTMLTITFNDQATNARVQQVVQAIHYHNDSNDPGTGDRTITFTATDRHGGTASDTRTVAITATNDAPTLTATPATLDFTEGEAPVSLFSGTAIDAVEADDKIIELVLTVTQVTDGAHEVLTIDGSGVSLTDGNSVASTANHAMAVGVAVTGTTATVTIGKAGGITPAEAQTLVNAIAYSNTSRDPTAANRVITLTSIQDNGGTADGGMDTTALAIASTVTVVPVNDPPEIDNLDGDAVSFSVGGAAVALDKDADVTLTDVDTSVFDGGKVTAAITANGQSAEDELLVGDVGPISLSGSNVEHTDGVTIGTVTGGTAGDSLVVTLNAHATVARVQDLLKALQYVNTNPDTVNTDPRTVSVTVDDGESEHSTSSVQSITVNLVRAPIIDLDSDGSTFTEKGGAVALVGEGATITDDGSFKSLTVTLTNRPDGVAESLSSTYGTGALTVNDEAVTIAAYDNATGVLHISVTGGPVSEATMQLLIQSIRYDNASNDPDTTARSITFSATDNDDHVGPPVTATLNMVAVNDPPTLTATGADPTFSQGGAAVSLFSDADASTVESGQLLKQLIITVTNVTDGDGANEWLSVDGQEIALSNGNSGTAGTNQIAYSVAWNDGTATLTLTKAGMNTAAVQALVEGLGYRNTSTPPSDSTRVVTITSLKDDGGTADGGEDTAVLSIASTVSVTPYPTLSSATYDAATGELIVIGAHIQANDSEADIDMSKLTLTGEGGETYTLTDSANVDRDSDTQFTVTLSVADRVALNQIINKIGTVSTTGTVYNLAAADDWNTAVMDGDTADMTGNGMTVSNVPVPAITSATYDASTGILVVTGTDFVKRAGDANDIDVSKLAFTGEGGESYTLTSDNVDITSGTAFTVTLNAADRVAVNQFLNKNGTDSTGGTPYNLAAAEDWAAGADTAVAVADMTGNEITVSNVAVPTITAATYDAGTGVLVVTGTDFLKRDGAANDIDVSKLAFTGEGGESYTLTSDNVDITSGTAFTVTLNAADRVAVNQFLNKNGTDSTGGTPYNLAAAEDWAAGADTAVAVADMTGNEITVSNVAVPTITAATYDAGTGVLVVTGTDFLKRDGAANDIDVSKLAFTGEGGESYTLTSDNVDITSGTAFTVTLNAADRVAVNQFLNKDGTDSTGGTPYNLAAAEDWAAGADTAVAVADMTGNEITVSNVAVPTITAATYDAGTGVLVVTGTDFLKRDGAANDIDVSKLAFTGEGGESYTLTSDNVDITSGTAFTVTLNAADRVAVNQFLNKNGTDSTGGTPYNLAAAEDWAAGADTAVAVADMTGNEITVSNVAVPTITAATYDAGTGVLVVTGTDFLKRDGDANDIDVSKLTITGQGGTTHTLTDTANVEITSSTSFSVTLSAADKTAVNQIINHAGATSVDDTVYNLAAAEGWAAGADAAVNVADLTGNGITATLPPPSSGGGGTAPPAVPTTATVDGMPVTIITQSDGAVLLTVPVVTDAWENDPTTSSHEHADIPVVTHAQGKPLLTVGLPIGVGLRAAGQPQAQSKSSAAEDLVARIQNKLTPGGASGQAMTAHAQQFIDTVELDSAVHVHTIELIADLSQRAEVPIMITGSADLASGKQLLVIDGSNLPAGTVLQLDDIAFAAVSGPVHLMGGKGRNFVTADGQDQVIILGADDDILFGGDGNDIVGSLGGDDFVSGGAGDDVVFGGTGNDILHGGPGNDRLNGGFGFDMALQEGGLADYEVAIHGHEVILTHRDGETDSLIDVELVRFDSGPSLAIAYSAAEAAAHHLVKTWLGRDLAPGEGNALQNWRNAEVDEIVAAFLNLPEAADLREKNSDELLAGLASNPYVIQLDVVREFIGSDGNDQGYLPLGLAMHVDGGAGHDVLRMAGGRDAVHLELVGDVVELTRLSDGAMLGLKNAEAIAFDSGETVLFAHNTTEGILGRLFHSFFNRDATSAEWQLGREALAAQVDPDIILDWFQEKTELNHLTDVDYIQALYWQTFGRQAAGSELQVQLLRLDNETVDRSWLAVEIAASDEAIDLVGNVILTEGWI